MRKIYPLSEQVIAKIAAGEVIERPVYAVKELIENALDAGATAITIIIEESGLKRITVRDNGEGMSREDITECFKPHTTSKLSSEEELRHIQTLGFRGEALSSIAAISTLFVQSKPKNEVAGTGIEVVEGRITKIIPVGMPGGTEVIVENLFLNVPGRKNFLKSPGTEFRHITSLITQYAFPYPEVHFVLIHNGRKILDLPKVPEISERIKILLGPAIHDSFIPVGYDDSYLSITGFLARPQINTKSASKQHIFINKRAIHDKLIVSAVKDAYGTLLESAAQPVFILFITTPENFVDVNVHPRKEQVRFIDTRVLYEAVYKAVSQSLVNNNILYFSDNLQGIGLADESIAARKYGFTNSYAGRILKENRLPWDLQAIAEVSPEADIVQLHKLYLVSQTKHGLLFVDQHAAHERILYEEFLAAFKSKQKEKAQYILSTPQVITVGVTEIELLLEHHQLFEDLGFGIEQFKNNSFLIRSVPLLFQDRNYGKLITEILEDLQIEKHPKDIDRISQRMIAYLACRAAVKAGDPLTKRQAKELVEKLEKTNNNATCPHGRPTRVIIDIERVDRMFKRKG